MTIQIHMSKIVSRVAIFLLPLLAIPLIIPPTVISAATPGTEGGTFTQVDIRARSWALAVFATSNDACGDRFGGSVSVDDAKNAIMYTNGSANAGYVVAPGTADSVDCKNGDSWLSDGLDLWGYSGDYQEFLYDLGYRQADNQENIPYSQLQLTSEDWVERNGTATGDTIAQVIKANAGPDANSPAPEVLYYATYTNFVLGCEASPLKLASEATNNEKTGDTAYIIKDVDPATGQIREMVYTAGKGKGANISTGPGIISGTNNPSCQQIADQLNQANLINAYSTYWKNAIAAGKQPLSNGAPVTGTGAAGANAEETDASCGDVGGAFGWLICAAADVVDGLAVWVESQLYELLRMKEIGGTDSPVYTAWASIRNVATAVLVLVALVAIAAQVFNLDFISAYTMKKIIPRIVIASILLFVSYFLAALAIQFVNALGDGIGSLIMGPFGDLAEASANGEAIQYILSQMEGLAGGEAAAASAVLLGVGATAFIGGAGLGGIILILFLVGGAIAVAFVTLVLRKVLILALVMAMPLAIIAWILPGTQKWFTSWWNLFTKLLLMYPLVIGLIAVGRVAAYLLAIGAGTASGAASIPAVWESFALDAQVTVVLIMVLVAYFGPYYFIPAMFKTAGGMFAKAVSTLDNAGRKYGRKTGDVASKKATGYVASKYNPSATTFKGGKGVNALARVATGNINPLSTKSAAMTAQVGAKYESEQREVANFLTKEATRKQDYDKANFYLKDQLSTGNRYMQQTAFDELVKRSEYQFIEEELIRRGPENGAKWFQTMVDTGGHAGTIMGARPDIMKGAPYDKNGGLTGYDGIKRSISSISVEGLASADKTFWLDSEGTDVNGNKDPNLWSHDNKKQLKELAKSGTKEGNDFKAKLDELRSNPLLYARLKDPARKVIDEILGPNTTISPTNTPSQAPPTPPNPPTNATPTPPTTMPPGATGGRTGTVGPNGIWTPRP